MPCDINDNVGKFLPLFPQLASKIKAKLPGRNEVPYDCYCPTIHTQLYDRMCTVCHLYFATKDSLKNHLKAKLHSQSEINMVCSRVRPKLILKINKSQEALCILQDNITEEESAEWIDVEEMDASDISEFEYSNNKENTAWPAIENLQEWLSSPWTTE